MRLPQVLGNSKDLLDPGQDDAEKRPTWDRILKQNWQAHWAVRETETALLPGVSLKCCLRPRCPLRRFFFSFFLFFNVEGTNDLTPDSWKLTTTIIGIAKVLPPLITRVLSECVPEGGGRNVRVQNSLQGGCFKSYFWKIPFWGRNQLSLNCYMHYSFSWGNRRGVG